MMRERSVRWNVSRMLWSVEYANAAVGQTLDFNPRPWGRCGETARRCEPRAKRFSRESDAQTSRMLLLAWGRVKRGDHDDIS